MRYFMRSLRLMRAQWQCVVIYLLIFAVMDHGGQQGLSISFLGCGCMQVGGSGQALLGNEQSNGGQRQDSFAVQTWTHCPAHHKESAG